MSSETESLRRELEKRATFEVTVKKLHGVVLAGGGLHTPGDIFTLVSRTATLLKARYQNPGFWRAGLGLFQACQVCRLHGWIRCAAYNLVTMCVNCQITCVIMPASGTVPEGAFSCASS